MNILESTLPKVLLLAGASHLEHEFTSTILAYFSEATGGNTRAVAFVNNKALARQYHSYFEWERSNANSFFRLFGEDFKTYMKTCVDQDPELASSIKAFLEIGSLRNQLVHQNYATFTLNKTASEIYDLYRTALLFIERIATYLRKEVAESQRRETS